MWELLLPWQRAFNSWWNSDGKKDWPDQCLPWESCSLLTSKACSERELNVLYLEVGKANCLAPLVKVWINHFSVSAKIACSYLMALVYFCIFFNKLADEPFSPSPFVSSSFSPRWRKKKKNNWKYPMGITSWANRIRRGDLVSQTSQFSTALIFLDQMWLPTPSPTWVSLCCILYSIAYNSVYLEKLQYCLGGMLLLYFKQLLQQQNMENTAL